MIPWRLATPTLVLATFASVWAPRSTLAQAPPPARTAHPKPLAQALSPEAKADYDAGKILFEDGDFQTSRIKFQAAYDLTHDARLLWNIAVCQKNERHYAKALATLTRYVADGGGLLTPGDRRDAEDLSKAITPFTSAATLHVSEDGAEVWVDDQLVGTSPLAAPVRVDLGPRKVRARKDGFRLFDHEFEVGGNATVTLDVVMERQSGHLELRVAPNAVVSIDGKDIGQGPLVDVDLPVGGHELRVTEPGMRPYQGDLVIEDGRTRAFDVTLERAPAPVSEVRVAVGCGRPEAGSPEEGLSVFFDGAKDSAPAFGTRRRTEDGSVSYVPYAVEPGKHTVRVALTGCDADAATIDAPAGGSTNVTGMLPPSRPWIDASPELSPDLWHLSAGGIVWSQTFNGYGGFFHPSGGSLTPSGPAILSLDGVILSAGIQGRWLTLVADARVAHTSHDDSVASTSSVLANTNVTSALTIGTVGIRPGVRLPLLYGAVSAGVMFDVGGYDFSAPSVGPGQAGVVGDAGGWFALEVKPLCDWGVQLGISAATTVIFGANVDQQGETTSWLNVFYEPNAACQRARSGAYHLEAGPK